MTRPVFAAALAALLGVALVGAPARAVTHLRVRTVRLPSAPVALTFALGRLWVVAESTTGGSVLLRVEDRSAPATVATVGRPGPDIGAVAAGDGFLWAAAGAHLARIAPAPPYATRRVSLPGVASAVAVGGGHVWVTTIGARDLLLGLDPRTLRATRRIPLQSPVSRLASGLGSLWAIDERGLARIDTRTGRRTPVGLVGAPPSDVALADGKAWALGGVGIAAVSPAGRERWQARLPVHGGILTVSGAVAWATDDCGCSRGTLVAFDLRRRRVLGRVSTGTTPVAVAANGRTAWVANFANTSLSEVER